MDIRAVIFDLDGVLTDTAEYHFQAWKRLADEEGIPFTRADNEALRGVSRRQSLELLLKGRPVTEAQAQALMERKNAYYNELIKQISPADLLPGVRELLAELRQAGLKIAVASASKNARAVLDGLRIWDSVDALADGYSVARTKPAPDLFLHAAAQVGCPPSACLAVEDAAAGIEAAEAAGMWTLALGPAERFSDVRPDALLPSLEGVTWERILAALEAGQAAAQTWTVRETEPPIRNTPNDPHRIQRQETVFTIGNGYLGTRGSFEEGLPGDLPATLIHGLFDDAPVVYTELVNAPNWLACHLIVEGQPFRMDQGEVLAYERRLDLRDGVLTRFVRWRSPKGHTLELRIQRWASMAQPAICALHCGVTALDFAGEMELVAELNGAVENPLPPFLLGLTHWQLLDQGHPTAQSAFLHLRTRASQIELGAAMHLAVDGVTSVDYLPRDCPQRPSVLARFHLEPGQTAVATKLVAFMTLTPNPLSCRNGFSRDFRRGGEGDEGLGSLLADAVATGYSRLLARHRQRWAELWRDCDVVIEGDEVAQRAVRYNLFQLLIAAPHHTDRASIPAKTLSGFGYRGHVFWDTDIFIIPFFTFTRPELARNLLMYRYHTLPGARQKARQAGYAGAMFAWESAGDGRETTPRWVPLPNGELVRIWCGDIEHHISADVAYAVWHYWQATGDDGFMRDYGAEILLDTAVFWGSRAEYNPERERYEINDVIGPDEYHEHVNNNAFTNRMVQWHLERALDTLAWLRERHPDKARELEERLDLSQARLARWEDIRRRIAIPHDPASGLIEQFEGFFALEELDWGALEPRTRSVQELLGMERIQHVQAIKQPDVLMLLYLLRDEYDEKALRVNWDYYAPRTDHTYGSSLGPAIHAILACALGKRDAAYTHFLRAALVDLEDLRKNTKDGIHAASAGGVWQAIVMGFAGMALTPEGPTFAPRLPKGWRRLQFTLKYRGRAFPVDLQPDTES
jgi:beta-phosphoglucomutase